MHYLTPVFIQREASAAAGHHIPLVVENVRGAIPWVGRSRWNYGSYHLWGDVPALMPMTKRATKNDGGSWFGVAHNTTSGHGKNPVGRNDPRDDIKVQAHLNKRNGHRSTSHLTNPHEHIKWAAIGLVRAKTQAQCVLQIRGARSERQRLP